MSSFRHPTALEAARAVGALTPAQMRRLWGGRGHPEGFSYDRRRRLWLADKRPPFPLHAVLLMEVYLHWLEAGHTAMTFLPEPQLPYRSPSGGRRHLDPDALFMMQGAPVALEVDRGTEGRRALVHKWWRYREYQSEAYPLEVVVLGPASRVGILRETLSVAGLVARQTDRVDEVFTVFSG